MPRPFGIVLIAVASMLSGVVAWFCLIWLLSVGANLIGVPVPIIAMLVLSPHVAGWLVAVGLGTVIFVLGIRFARKRGLAWLGFAANSASDADPN